MEGRRVPQSDKTAMQRSIMEATIHIVAQYGLDKTTTRLIAAEAGLNEAYLYRCFKNKEDILSESFRAVDFAFVAHLHKILPVMQLAGTTWEERCFLQWRACWEFILKNPENCRFYIRYYYSANCKSYAYAAHLERYRPLIDAIRPAFRAETNVDMLLHQIFDTMLSFAERVQTGELPNNEETTQATFRQVFSFVAIHARPELVRQGG